MERLEALGTSSGGTTPTQTQPTQAVRIEDRWYGHPARVASLFGVVALAVLGVVYFLTIQLGLPDWVPWGAVALLGAGLPIMIVTGLVERRRAKAKQTGVYSPSGETGLRGWITWRRAIQGGMAAFSVLGAGAVIYTAMRLLGIGPVGTLVASGKLSARDKLLVADFVNKAADTTLGGSLTEAFRIDLAQSPRDLGDEHLRSEFGAQPDESRSGQGPGCDHRPGTGGARGSQGHRRRRDQPGREGLRHLRPGAFGDRRE